MLSAERGGISLMLGSLAGLGVPVRLKPQKEVEVEVIAQSVKDWPSLRSCRVGPGGT